MLFNFQQRGQVQLGVIDKADYNPFKPGLGVICNHIMFNMKGVYFCFDIFVLVFTHSIFTVTI